MTSVLGNSSRGRLFYTCSVILKNMNNYILVVLIYSFLSYVRHPLILEQNMERVDLCWHNNMVFYVREISQRRQSEERGEEDGREERKGGRVSITPTA